MTLFALGSRLFLIQLQINTHANKTPNRYLDWDRQVHLAKSRKGGQEGDPLEMLIFNLTILHLWGRVLAKFPEDRMIVYVDDSMIVTSRSS